MRAQTTLALFGALFLPSFTIAQPTFDDYFPRVGWSGKSASALSWSHDNRYLLYRWNKIDEPGMDLWLYDSTNGKTQRLTDPKTFEPFDRDIPRALVAHKERLERDQKIEKMSEMEYREFLEEERKRNESRRGGTPSYGGPDSAVWGRKSHDLLVTYRGDLYRMQIGQAKPTRMTWTRENETNVQFLPDDSGFTYRRGDGVYMMKFDSPAIRQLNPPLPNNLPLGSYSISPDGSKLMITSFRSLGQSRQVDWIQYRDRFATAQKTSRQVADDKFNSESYMFLYDMKDILADNDLAEPRPWEVYKFPGGEEWWESAVHSNPWSPDGKQFVFATWKRDQKAFDLIVADLETRKTKTVYATKLDGDHNSPGMADPFFTPDGKQIVLLLESSGYRHAWMVDPMKEGAVQISRGDFETYPLKVTPDGKKILALSGKEHPARMNLYAVDIASGNYERITKATGNYERPTLSEDGTKAVIGMASWSTPRELYALDLKDGKQNALTDSHRLDRFKKLNVKQPELFTYQNRHGQTIHGYMFLPDGWKKEDKRPLMIYVYGGPLGTGKSVIDGSFNSTAYWFNLYLTQALGFVTVTIDPRGQSGYGAVFGKANWEQVGVPQTEDLTDGVKHLVENFGVDPKRVAMNGWSFGGFQTQMSMYTAPDVFTLGIAGAGPTEWQNYNTWYSGGVIGNARDGKPEDLDKYSLTHLAKNLKNPLLLLHGVEDTNVLFQDTIKVYRKLLQYGKGHMVELSIDPTGGHGMGGDMNNRDRHLIYLEFIKRWWRL